MLSFWGWAAASPLLRGQESRYTGARRTPLNEIINAGEMETAARLALSTADYDRIAAGAGAERTLRSNREKLEKITFRPRMLVNVTKVDLSIELFGQRMFAPMLVGPSALHGRVHLEAEAATAAGAAAGKTTSVISDRSTLPLDQIGATASAAWWAQLRPGYDARRLAAAGAAGAKAIMLTVDAEPRASTDAAVRFSEPSPGPRAFATRRDALGALTVLKQATKLPVVVKGILRPEDAVAVVAAGADGVVVSNHGGRAVDGLPATIEALPRVADAVGDDVPVLVDGGFRRGTDVVKALSLGARAVLLGRPVLWALAAYGEAGVQKLFELMQHETALAMGLGGKVSVGELGQDFVRVRRR